jgi:hypothetical protein
MGKFLFQEADFYGASKLIFEKNKLPLCYKSTWTHGLGFALEKNYCIDLVKHPNEKKLPLHLVNNEETVSHFNYQKVKSIAVGMPIIYTKNFFENNKSSNYKRLFVPSHSINSHGDINQLDKWKKIIYKYKCDSLCLNVYDFNLFKKKKFFLDDVKIIKGAYAGDDTSLERISQIFLSTKEMVTDDLGSHIPYASACGANVRILDEISEISSSYVSDRSNRLKTIPRSQKKIFQEYWSNPYEKIKKITSSIWVKGNDLEKKEYSEYLLGVKHRKKIDVVREYLTPISLNQKIYIFSSILIKKFYNKYL